jgi:hypothetical protein
MFTRSANSTRDPSRTKRLSYERDTRNTYGENSKSSRKNVRRRKRLVNRTNRRQQQLALVTVQGAVTEDDASAGEQRLNAIAQKRWSKVPDSPLGQVVRNKIAKRLAKR